MKTPVKNFAKVTVSTGYDASATSWVLTTGHGSKLPSEFPFPMTWWNSTDYADPNDDPNREIVLCTGRTGDTASGTRGAEGTSASTKNTAGKTYKMLAGFTAAMYDAIFNLSLAQDFRGLTLQTHPDSDKALSTVRLLHADAIVMDDGEEIADWNDLDADIIVSGAGGLDTGSEIASTWFQVIAIYNPSTATKKIMLHRAKDYFLDEIWDQSGGTTEDGQHLLRDAAARTKLNQGLKVDTAGLLEMIDVKIARIGSPTGNFWFTLETNSGGVPSGTVLATSDKYDAGRLGTTSRFIRLPFRAPASLSAATQYHLVLQADSTISGANHLLWRADTTAATYANGSKAAYDGTTWTNDTDDDFLFKAYITRNDVAVTLPAGYTQQALIGWVCNNASSNFKPMRALNRKVFCGFNPEWLIGTFNAQSNLIDMSAFLPPVPTVVAFDYSQITNAGLLSIGGLNVTDIGASGDGLVASNGGLGQITPTNELFLDGYQGMMLDSSAASAKPFLVTFTW